MTGIFRSVKGCTRVFPWKLLYRSSSGWTATPCRLMSIAPPSRNERTEEKGFHLGGKRFCGGGFVSGRPLGLNLAPSLL